ncbi:hypothetical protein [Shewanella youngdeokensis]|uniref:Uncharacterized protein n=1 Tax=Shewanella youngdeokensis TaxID=2999068 RepID=A0ABZ0JWS6_9GAMM|nr:hypothetical protein RGE70_15815 [Shewanella sp. DAU334]
MQKITPIVFVILLFCALSWAIVSINQTEKSLVDDNWSSFIYKNGYNSGGYDKQDNFDNYQSCKEFSQQQSQKLNNATWECGLNCRFDAKRQGFHCDKMTND